MKSGTQKGIAKARFALAAKRAGYVEVGQDVREAQRVLLATFQAATWRGFHLCRGANFMDHYDTDGIAAYEAAQKYLVEAKLLRTQDCCRRP